VIKKNMVLSGGTTVPINIGTMVSMQVAVEPRVSGTYTCIGDTRRRKEGYYSNQHGIENCTDWSPTSAFNCIICT